MTAAGTSSPVTTVADTAATTAPDTVGVTTAITSVAPTTAPATTAAPTTTAGPLICASGPGVPDGISPRTTIAEDLDSDGFAELLSTYFVTTEDRWHFRVEFATGGSVDQVIDGSSGVFPALPLGTFDVEGDGSPEIFVQVSGADGVSQVGFYDVAGCNVTRIGGAIDVLSVGLTADTANGIACAGDGFIVSLFAGRVGVDEWESGFGPYFLDGAVLEVFPGDGGGVNDAGAAALANIACGDVGL